MIETHVVNATLLPSLREGDLFHVLSFLNGLVAPSFVFAAGLAFAVTLRRKIGDYLHWTPVLRTQLARLLLILIIGYILHIPKFSLNHLLYVAGEQAWRDFFQVDVLQCIAVTLLFLQFLVLILRTESRLSVAAAAVSLLVVFTTPIVWTVDAAALLPVPLAAYVNPGVRSQFPLFPWAAFLLCGAMTGYAYLELRERIRPYLLAAGLAAIALSFVLDPLLAHVYPVYSYWRGSPSFFLLRLGLVLAISYVLYAYELRRGVRPSSLITLVGRESLMVYVAHLLLIYGNFGTFNFRDTVAHSFGYPAAFGVSLVLIALMCLLAFVWSRIKRGPVAVRRRIELGFIALIVVVFFVAPA